MIMHRADQTLAIRALKSAAPYIRMYKGKTFVVKAGGGVVRSTIDAAKFVVALLFLGTIGTCVYVCGSAAKAVEDSKTSTSSSPSPMASAPVAEPSAILATPAAVEVTARQLFADYQENEVSADSAYRGKVLRVSGKITRIGKDILDDPFLELATSNQFMGVLAKFKSGGGGLDGMKRGERVTVRCRGDNVFAGSPILADCALDSAVEPPREVIRVQVPPPVPPPEGRGKSAKRRPRSAPVENEVPTRNTWKDGQLIKSEPIEAKPVESMFVPDEPATPDPAAAKKARDRALLNELE